MWNILILRVRLKACDFCFDVPSSALVASRSSKSEVRHHSRPLSSSLESEAEKEKIKQVRTDRNSVTIVYINVIYLMWSARWHDFMVALKFASLGSLKLKEKYFKQQKGLSVVLCELWPLHTKLKGKDLWFPWVGLWGEAGQAAGRLQRGTGVQGQATGGHQCAAHFLWDQVVHLGEVQSGPIQYHQHGCPDSLTLLLLDTWLSFLM